MQRPGKTEFGVCFPKPRAIKMAKRQVSETQYTDYAALLACGERPCCVYKQAVKELREIMITEPGHERPEKQGANIMRRVQHRKDNQQTNLAI